MIDLDTVTIGIMFVSGLVNVVLVIWVGRLSIERRNLHWQLYQRERWHEKELKRWRERL